MAAKVEVKKLNELVSYLTDQKYLIEVSSCKMAEAIIKRRVFNLGLTTNGTQMKSKSEKKKGAYSYSYALARQAAGRQINVMDLQFTGQLINDIQVGKTTAGVTCLGITTQESIAKAKKNEERQGTIFQLSAAERQQVVQGTIKLVRQSLLRFGK